MGSLDLQSLDFLEEVEADKIGNPDMLSVTD